MKKCLFFSALVIFSVASWCGDITVKSRINSVEIFSDRAVVERTATVEPPPGTQTVVFEGLPPSIIEDTIKVSGKGTASCEIMGTEIDVQDVEIPEIKELEKRIELLEIEKKKTNSFIELLDQQEELLESILTNSTAQTGKEVAEGKPDMVAIDKLFNFLTLKYNDISIKKLESGLKLTELDKKYAELNMQYSELTSRKAKKGKKVSVLIKCENSGSLSLSLFYTVKGCSWAPAYIAKALPDTSQMEITTMASIVQKTYEDWEDAAVTFPPRRPLWVSCRPI